jgi:tetratricopeptide (TPR) repeat protein
MMFRKLLISLVFIVGLVVGGQISVAAQNSPVSGTVELEKADGTREPVANALIEVYRTDIKTGFPSTKTNRKGEFAFAGLPLGGTFAFAVSAPGAAPTIFPNVRAGQEKLLILMRPGDGSKLSEADVRTGVSAKPAATGELTAEQKKQQAEFEKANAEIIAKNEKAKKANEVVGQMLKEGNEAFTAKNYDLAIAKYDEGLAADPDFVGSAPVLNNNRATALTTRAVEIRNRTFKSADVNEKIDGLQKAKKDLADAATGFLRAWTILNNAQVADIADKANFEATKVSTLRGAKETFRMAIGTEQVDPVVIDAAKVLVPEYLKVETDAAKKAEVALTMADLYRVSGDSENAVMEYRKVLDASPDHLDALAGAGFSLVNVGYMKVENGKSGNNKAMQDEGKKDLQDGSNLLGKFASAAPETHRYKKDALDLIEILKKEQNVTPQKVAPRPKRP